MKKLVKMAAVVFFQCLAGLISFNADAGNSPAGFWNVSSVQCHLGAPYTGAPVDPVKTKITWNLKEDFQYQVNVQSGTFSYIEKGSYGTRSARICFSPFEGYSSDEGYIRFPPQQHCGSFVRQEAQLTLLLEVYNPERQGCPIGDMVEIRYSLIPKQASDETSSELP